MPTKLRAILRYLGVNSGDMEKGAMRFEANISIRPAGSSELNTRTEIKNLNSFRALVRATEYEIARQIRVVESGGQVEQETLGWNETRGETYTQRGKEHAHDYRYFPEPDLLPLEISREASRAHPRDAARVARRQARSLHGAVWALAVRRESA